MTNKKCYRKKICEDIDQKLIADLDLISAKIDIPKSRLCEEAIKYILKNQISPLERTIKRKDITLTINSAVWIDFKNYAETKKYKIVHLLEAGLKYTVNKYKRKIQTGKL